MKIRVPKYFKKFKCIASECTDTCCAGWEIVIDEESYEHYQNVQGQFGDRLRKSIIDDDEGDKIFTLKGNRCAFLNDNDLCDIYSELGEESLCYTCKQYPRYTEEFGSLRETGISLSCPEAARIMLRDKEKVTFELTENEEEVSSYNSINPMLFIELTKCRKVLINILQNDNIEFNHRMAVALQFIKEVQEKIDYVGIESIKEVVKKYSNEQFVKDSINNLYIYDNKSINSYKDLGNYFKVFKELKHINENIPQTLDNALTYFNLSDNEAEQYMEKHRNFKEYYKDNIYKFENMVVYFVFRYFMKAVFDYDALAKIKLSIISCIIINELCTIKWIENGELKDEDIELISQIYSKDVEHLEENIETLSEIFETNSKFEVEQIITVLLN